MEYSITVTVGDHSPEVDVVGNAPFGTYEITGSDDVATHARGLILPDEPGSPKLHVTIDEDQGV